jgi:hypothetical protein
VKRNGTYALLVQTRHGQFTFQNQKFHCPDGGSSAFLQANPAGQSAVTRGLEALAVALCLNTRSYEMARQTLGEVTGACLLTRQTLCNWVAKTARRLDRHLAHQVQQAAPMPLPPLAETVDLYDATVTELPLFEDGILVKAQKPTHAKAGENKTEKPCQFHQAYFSLAPCPDGRYQFVLGSSDGAVSISAALRSFVSQQWKDATEPLCLVAITDGAKDLRNDLREAFGERLPIILDWYHLRKKVCELASMLVSTREARAALKKQLLRPLFYGQVSDALQTLGALPVRNALMHGKLATYLSNHAHEIIDYARRRQLGKTIGSGRMEKGVDQVIGMRQKDNGMSWSKRGSYALGMLSAYRANGHWNQLWNTNEIAA